MEDQLVRRNQRARTLPYRSPSPDSLPPHILPACISSRTFASPPASRLPPAPRLLVVPTCISLPSAAERCRRPSMRWVGSPLLFPRAALL